MENRYNGKKTLWVGMPYTGPVITSNFFFLIPILWKYWDHGFIVYCLEFLYKLVRKLEVVFAFTFGSGIGDYFNSVEII